MSEPRDKMEDGPAGNLPPGIRRSALLWLYKTSGGSISRAITIVLMPLLLLGSVVFAGVVWVVQPTPVAAEPLVITLARSDKLEADVRTLVEDFGPRHAGDAAALDATSQWIYERFVSLGLEAGYQDYRVDGRRARNVMARLGPEHGELVIVGAHYDAHKGTPGADDNASGVAGLLELARLLAWRPPSVPVQLVAYTHEEPPYFRTDSMGSAVHAAALTESETVVRLMISLEMIGYFSDEPHSQEYPVGMLRAVYPSRGDFIAVVGNITQGGVVRRVKRGMRSAGDLPVHGISAPQSLAGVDFSDHLNFWNAGYPAVMVTDTSFFRNKAYHTAEDTPDTLDYQRMAQVVDGVMQVVLAEQPR